MKDKASVWMMMVAVAGSTGFVHCASEAPQAANAGEALQERPKPKPEPAPKPDPAPKPSPLPTHTGDPPPPPLR